jgi:peptidoglycan/xylan/chitin deacetylase (PgdA/CDA1 family)
MGYQTVLIFHGIGVPRPELPAEEHPYWISKEFFEEILQTISTRQHRHPVVLTFDDGNDSDLFAAERLAAAGLAGKFYLLTGRFGQPHYISRDHARDLVRAGFEVGLHGRNHIDWRQASSEVLEAETVESRAELADAIDRPVQSAAIPFGAYNRRVINHLLRQTFDRVYTSDAGPARTERLFRRRTSIMALHSIEDVIALLDDRSDSVARARRLVTPIIKRWR